MDPALLGIGARLVQLGGASVLFGAPLLVISALRGEGGAAAVRLGWPRRALPLAAFLVMVGAVGSLAAQAANVTGDPSQATQPATLWTVLSGTEFGQGLAVRMALTALALLISRPPDAHAWTWQMLALLGAGVLASFAWTGHGAMDEGPAGVGHLAADVVHLLAAGAWIGALVVFLACLSSTKLRREPEAVAGLHLALKRFSGIGSLCVALLLATGLVNGWFLVGAGHVAQIPYAPYGQALIAKLALFLVMVALAASNRFFLTPRLARADRPRTAIAALRSSIALETLAAFAVLALVAWLGTQAPLSMA